MLDFSRYTEVGKTTNTVTYTLESDPDVLLIVPLAGTKDNAKDAHENAAFIGLFDSVDKAIDWLKTMRPQ
jgi:hypothetical protein